MYAEIYTNHIRNTVINIKQGSKHVQQSVIVLILERDPRSTWDRGNPDARKDEN